MSWNELARLDVRCRRITEWPQPFTKKRIRSPFKAAWGTTVAGLARELRHLGGRSIALHIAVPESRITVDGSRPYVDARPDHPGVLLAFESKQGAMHFAVDTFSTWQDNLRAIVLTLENLRAIERYGTVSRAQQYRGFRALEDTSGTPAFTTGDAVRWLQAQLSAEAGPVTAETLMSDPAALRDVYRTLAGRLHPDKPGGSSELFVMLGEARRVLAEHIAKRAKGAA